MTAKTTKTTAKKADEIEYDGGLPFYPQYCFKLSPTINTYCHLRASDIEAFKTRAGFGGQNVFFHLNHPIRWVRIAGIVVAIDEFPGRRIYTLDDSSGTSIECVIHAPTPDAAVAAAAAVKVEAKPDTAEARQWKGSASTSAEIKTTIPADVDVGTLIEVKGGLTLFRGHKQIKILKVTILRSTEQEVAFWEKIMQFRQDVLDKQWNLKDKEVRRCRKGEERRR